MLLTWRNNGDDDPILVLVFKSPAEQNGVTRLDGNSESYRFDNLNPATWYIFRVLCFYAGDQHSDTSAVVEGLTWLAPPTELRATGVADDSIRIAWRNNAEGIQRVEVQRIEGNTISINNPVDTCRFPGLEPLTDYSFRVRYFTQGNQSAWSEDVSATTWEAPPEAPTQFRVDSLFSSEHVSLSFQDNANAETGFRIQRRENDGEFEDFRVLGQIGDEGERASFEDEELTYGSTYRYRVKSESEHYSSVWLESPDVLSTFVVQWERFPYESNADDFGMDVVLDHNQGGYYVVGRSPDGDGLSAIIHIDNNGENGEVLQTVRGVYLNAIDLYREGIVVAGRWRVPQGSQDYQFAYCGTRQSNGESIREYSCTVRGALDVNEIMDVKTIDGTIYWVPRCLVWVARNSG